MLVAAGNGSLGNDGGDVSGEDLPATGATREARHGGAAMWGGGVPPRRAPSARIKKPAAAILPPYAPSDAPSDDDFAIDPVVVSRPGKASKAGATRVQGAKKPKSKPKAAKEPTARARDSAADAAAMGRKAGRLQAEKDREMAELLSRRTADASKGKGQRADAGKDGGSSTQGNGERADDVRQADEAALQVRRRRTLTWCRRCCRCGCVLGRKCVGV